MDSMRDGSENEGSSSLVFSEINKNEDLSEYVSLFAKKENTLRENFNKIYETDTNHLQEIIYKLKETVQKQSQQIVEDNIKLSSLTKLQYENTEYIEQLLCLNQKCDFLENQNKQSYNDKIELGSEITSLKNDLIEKQHHNQELTNAIICYKEQINNLVSEIESYAKLKLEQEHNETNKEDHCLKLTLNAYRKENIEMSNKIKDFNQDLNTIRQEKDKIVKDNLRLIRLYTQQNDMIEDLEKLQVETKNAINKKVEISNSKNDKKILILEKLKNNYFDIVKERDEILYENENLKNDVEMRKTKEKGNINQQVQVAFEPNFNCKNCITLKNNLNSVANRLSQFICSNKNLKNKMSVLEMSQLKEKSKICEIEEQHYYINNLEEKNKKLKDSSIFLRKEISCILNMINNEKCYNIAQNKSENVQKASMLIRQNNSMKNHVDRIIQPQFNYSFKPNHINRKKYKLKEKSKKYFIQDGQVLDMKKKFPLEKNKKYISKIRELMAAQYMVNVLSIEKSNCVITQNEQRKLINQLERKNNTIEKSTQIMKKRLMRISTINEQLNTKIMTYTFMESDYKILKNSESDKSEKLNQLIVYNNNNRKELQSLRVELMKYHELCKTMNLDMMSLHSACKNQQMELIVKRNSIKTFIDNDKNMRNEIVNLKNDLTQFKNTYRNSKTVQFQLNQTVNSLKSQISAYVEQNQNSNNAIDQLTDSIDEHKLTIQQNERNISLMENRQQYLLYKTDQNMNKIISSYKNILELQNKKVTNCSSRILKYRNFLMTLTNMLCEKNIEKTESIVDSGNDTDLEQTYISEAKVKASKILNMDKHLMESICTISNYKQKELINKEFKSIHECQKLCKDENEDKFEEQLVQFFQDLIK